MSKSTVYIVQKPDEKKNITSALDYGEFQFLLSESTNNTLLWTPQEVVSTLQTKLRNFNDNDYLLPIGDPVVIGMSTAIAADYNDGRVRFLKWDNREYKYHSIEVQLWE